MEQIFQNVYGYLSPGGWFVFDLLNEREVSTSEPFEMDFTESTRVWFQMTRPGEKKVNLKIRVYENGELEFEEKKNRQIYWDDVALFCHPEEYALGILPMQKGDLLEIDDLSELIAMDGSYGIYAQGVNDSE